MDAYNTEKESIIESAEMNSYFSDIDLEQEYNTNNFQNVTNLMDTILDTAVNNMNQGVNMKVEDLRQLINLSITTNSLAAMHDVTKYNLQHNRCSMSLGIDVAIDDAITEAKTTQQSQSQEMGL